MGGYLAGMLGKAYKYLSVAEIDTFSGYIVREANKLGVPAPVSEEMYEGLKKKSCV